MRVQIGEIVTAKVHDHVYTGMVIDTVMSDRPMVQIDTNDGYSTLAYIDEVLELV